MMPLIGITCSFGVVSNSNLSSVNTNHMPQEFNQLSDAYVKAIENAGGIPVIIPILSEEHTLYQLLNRLDGIVLSGGSDIDPQYCNQRASSHVGGIAWQRDRQEINIINYMRKHGRKPILGICRGMQMLNAAFGGTLHQDLEADGFQCHILKMYPRDMPSHKIKIMKDSFIGTCFSNEEIGVNSFHHQGISQVGADLTATAISDDDLIEAIEYQGKEPLIVGVQWHPEAMQNNNSQKNIFHYFVDACNGEVNDIIC